MEVSLNPLITAKSSDPLQHTNEHESLNYNSKCLSSCFVTQLNEGSINEQTNRIADVIANSESHLNSKYVDSCKLNCKR